MTIFFLPKYLHYAYHFSVDSGIKKERKGIFYLCKGHACNKKRFRTEIIIIFLGKLKKSFSESVHYKSEHMHRKSCTRITVCAMVVGVCCSEDVAYGLQLYALY